MSAENYETLMQLSGATIIDIRQWLKRREKLPGYKMFDAPEVMIADILEENNIRSINVDDLEFKFVIRKKQ